MTRTLWLAAMPVLLIGCAASTPAPRPQAHPPAQAARDADAVDLEAALLEAQQQILARTSGNVKPTFADAEAMASITIPEHKSIQGAVEYFSTRLQEKIQKSLLRSAEYKPMVDKVLDEYRLPRALAYLPVIESAYIPTLTSSAGAYGLWQFMAPTAREYGLNIDWWVDERAHPESATRAAAYYLRDLYRMFDDWSLALAAYNAGPGRVRRALNSTGSSTFWELYDNAALPRETRGYVPTFYATVIIASDPEAYGFELRENSEYDVRRVTVEGPVSLDYIAEVCGAPVDELRRLNPHLRQGIVPPRATSLRVPSEKVEKINARAASLRYEDPHMKIATFTLRPGDTLTKLSRAIGVTPEEIARMNNKKDSEIRTGSTIFLPVHQTELSTRLEAARTASASRYHIVKKGDTLYSIARQNGLTIEELLDLNRLSASHVLQPGERLRVTLSATLTGGM
jgi:membrane-bound lytic murein transglycosylase D